MNRPFRILAAALVIGGALALAAGCGRNTADTLLAPTGIRPAPASWPGSITGAVFFDPANTPDLGTAPFPPTRVELFQGATLVAVDSLEPASRNYLFTGLAPGSYSIVVRSRVFNPNSRGGLPVRDGQLDAGNINLTLNSLLLANAIYVAGTIPGLGPDELPNATGILDGNGYGVWHYPNTLWDPPVQVPAGTYRFKLVTDESSTLGHLIGWGGDATQTLVAPVTDHFCVFGTGPETDLVVQFPVSGLYTFTFDERRQTFSVALAPPAPALLSGR